MAGMLYVQNFDYALSKLSLACTIVGVDCGQHAVCAEF